MENSNFVFDAIVIKEDDGYSSLCLNLDVASEGDTIDEAKINLKEAVTLYLETTIENNLPIIRHVPVEENPNTLRPNDIVDKFILKVDVNVHIYV
ncbi:MAG: type II toxin-antitoxin system HicB family antitoxin [Bacteroidota bacterium]|nr:type II toxin-antitoxin system HicB family antitoxin [Bacteroidota bacterium]